MPSTAASRSEAARRAAATRRRRRAEEERKKTAGLVEITADLDKIEVKSVAPYVELHDENKELDNGRLYHTGDDEVTLSLGCGDNYIFSIDDLFARLITVKRLSVIDSNEIPDRSNY